MAHAFRHTLEETNKRNIPPSPKRVGFLLLSQVQLLDLAGPAQVFYVASQINGGYELIYCASEQQVTSAQGLQLSTLHPVEDLLTCDLIFIPGVDLEVSGVDTPILSEAECNCLRWVCSAGIPVASVCTGAFALGEAGLLQNRRCTTHWLYTDLLQQSYPTASVIDNVLFVADSGITTSAGIASGLDMALWLIEQDQGALFTAQVARLLVVYMRRNGAQQQHSVYLDYRTHLNSSVHFAQDFIVAHISDCISLDEIAHAARLSKRTLSRVFKQETKLTPIQYQQHLRLALAQSMMMNPHLTIEQVAERCGFADERHFRRLWKARYGAAPSASRGR